VLERLGPAALADARVLPLLMRLSESKRAGHRGAAAVGLGGVAAEGAGGEGVTRVVVDRLLELTRDHPWVAGRAIDALGLVRAEAGGVVTRLVELFDEFEEFDPDEAYDGKHARVCRALEAFRADAAPAAARLVEALRGEIDDEQPPLDVLGVLEAIGPGARAAAPVVRELLERMLGRGGDAEEGPVAVACRKALKSLERVPHED
jgi:hypothetical protein